MINAAHHPWIRIIARTGYASRGVIYLIVGGLTLFAAFGISEVTSTRTALQTLLSQPFGTVMLWAVLFGLFGYVLWRLIQSLLDTDDHGWTPKGLGVRIGLLASAMTYSALGLYALGLLGLTDHTDDETGETRNWLLDMAQQFLGADAVSLAGAVVFACVAGAHIWKAVARRYEDHFRTHAAPMALVHPVSIIGLLARGIIFAVIAWLLAYRYWTAKKEGGALPDATDALDYLRALPWGSLIIGTLGAGLVCFALYSLFEAKWRRINVEDADHPADQSAG